MERSLALVREARSRGGGRERAASERREAWRSLGGGARSRGRCNDECQGRLLMTERFLEFGTEPGRAPEAAALG
jgi:hypothetical protein